MVVIILIVLALCAIPFLMVKKDISDARKTGSLVDIICAIAEILLVLLYVGFIIWKTWG